MPACAPIRLRKALEQSQCGMFVQTSDPSKLSGWPWRSIAENAGASRIIPVPKADGPGTYCAVRERFRDHECICNKMEFDDCGVMEGNKGGVAWTSSLVDELKRKAIKKP